MEKTTVVDKISERLNEKKFMHRGEDDEEEEREYGVSFVTILHELQKTYNWKRSFGLKKKGKSMKTAIDVDSVEPEIIKTKSHQKILVKKGKHDKHEKMERKHKEEKKPVLNEKIKEKREFKHSLKTKKDKKVLNF